MYAFSKQMLVLAVPLQTQMHETVYFVYYQNPIQYIGFMSSVCILSA